ncbi:MAG: HAMP domain-containing sensor histidine kinase [Chitinophagaceae bacterium]
MTSIKSLTNPLRLANDLYYYQQQTGFDAETISVAANPSLSANISFNPLKFLRSLATGKTGFTFVSGSNRLLKLLTIISTCLIVIYLFVFNSLNLIPAGSYSFAGACLPLLLSLFVLTSIYQNKAEDALFIMTWLLPSVMLLLSLHNPGIDFSKVLVLYMIAVLFTNNLPHLKIAGFSWLAFACFLMQLRSAMQTPNYNFNIALIESCLIPAVCLTTYFIADRLKHELISHKAEFAIQKELLEKKNAELEEMFIVNEAQTEKLKRTIALKDKLISVISHDVRVPINSFRFLIENYERGYIPEQMLLEGILESKKEIQKVDCMVMDLVNWARTGNPDAEKENMTQTELHEMMDSVLSIYARCAKNKELKVIPVINLPKDAQLIISKREMAIIVRNLLSNAMKYSETGKKIIVSVNTATDQSATLSVKDAGTGIHPSVLQRLNGNRVNSTVGTLNEVGLGVGLTIVFDVINERGLTYDIQSELNKGTEFLINIPMMAA